MWYIVVLTWWKHWNSEHGTTIGVPVYAVDWHMAIKLVEQDYAVCCAQQVIACGLKEPKVVWND